ncbi:MAG: hypothetical protein ACYDAO_04720 [Thermoplasmataceae archaeon]
MKGIKKCAILTGADQGSKLLAALSVKIPKAIPNSGIKVSTRKKLETKRKK